MAGKDTNQTKLAVIQNDIDYIKAKLNEVDTKVSVNYVSRAEFTPIQRIVYGFVTLALVAVGGAIIAQVIK